MIPVFQSGCRAASTSGAEDAECREGGQGEGDRAADPRQEPPEERLVRADRVVVALLHDDHQLRVADAGRAGQPAAGLVTFAALRLLRARGPAGAKS